MSLGETAVGHTAALGALAAVLRARATGVGALVDCAAVEGARVGAVTDVAVSRLGVPRPHRRDRAHDADAACDTLLPLGVFPCADGYVAMMMTTQQLRRDARPCSGATSCAEAFARPDAFVQPGDEGDPRRRPLPVAARRARARRSPSRRRRPGGRSRRCTSRPSCSWPTTSTSAGSGCTPSTTSSARSCFPARRTGSPRAVGSCGAPRRASASATHRVAPRRRPATGTAGRGARPRRSAAARHPRARLHDRVVGSLPHRAARRPRRRGRSASRPRTCSRPRRRATSRGPSTDMVLGALARLYGPLRAGPRGPSVQPPRDEQRGLAREALVHARRPLSGAARAVHAPRRRVRRVRREPQVDHAAPDGDPRDRAAAGEPAHDRPAPPAGRALRRLGALHRLRRPVRRPHRPRRAARPPRHDAHGDAVDPAHGQRHRSRRRVRHPRRAALPRARPGAVSSSSSRRARTC